ncbi:MAG: AIR synthase [Candidatus Altiarchaeales archaeon]|nr:AIR synthase [Candidatus Altiarchaeales archaeon]
MKIGKVDLDFFEKNIKGRVGKENPKVLVPPQSGVDASVIEVDEERVLVVAEDPIFPAPGLPLSMFGWFSVHIGASDVAVLGVEPQYLTYSLLVPQDTEEKDLKEIVDSIHGAAKQLGISIVGGHTGYYPTVITPLVGGITVFGFAGKKDYVTPRGAKPGDKIVLTKGPAVEAAGLLSVLYEKRLKAKYDVRLVEKAKRLCKKITVVEDAREAMKTGQVTSMHDATEGGVIGGLFEIANASNVGVKAYEDRFIYPKETSMVCEELGIDPVEAIAEGSLIITCEAGGTQKVVNALAEAGIESTEIGEIVEDTSKRTLRRRDGSEQELAIPDQDPFWPAFFAGLKEKEA